MTRSKYQLESSVKKKGVKFCFYGPEGIGKSTLASQLPSTLFIDTEGSTDHMNVVRYPRPQSWDALLDMVEDAGNLKIRTLVIDTADWAERLCTDALCAAKGWKGIEDAGYGKGYVYQAEAFGKLLDKLTEIAEKGINVGFCAHAQLRKIEAPEETGAYDHWEMKLAKKIGPMVKEWADLLIFCNYKIMVVKGANPMEKNKVAGGKRVMYTSHHPIWDAKNRFGLPEELPMSYEAIREVFERKPKEPPEPIHIPLETPAPDFAAAEPAPNEPPQEQEPADELPENPFTGEAEGPVFPEPKPEKEWTKADRKVLEPTQLKDRFPDLAQLMEASGIQYAEVQAAVSNRGYFPGDMPIELYPADFVKGCLVAAWDSVKNLIMDMRRKNNG
jgi:DNA polymerase III delta prime subunit